MHGISWMIAGGCGLAAWSALFPLIKHLSSRQVIDIPNARSSHTRPTPRGGGLAIVAATLLGCFAFGTFTPGSPWLLLAVYSLAAMLIAGVSWLDDIWTLPSWVRFGVHSLSAVWAIACFGYVDAVTLPVVGTIPLGIVGPALTFVWIVGLTNAYNFMDGIDGIAGVQAVAAGAGWAILGYLAGESTIQTLGLLLVATSLGFLGHNWSPARIFMGDVGSTFLGFTFAVMPLLASRLVPALEVRGIWPVCGVILVWPFAFDAGLTFFRRLAARENVFAAHRSHLYQRLVRTNFTHRGVSLLYLALASAGATLVVAWSQAVPGSSLAIAGALPLACLTLFGFVTHHERHWQANHSRPGVADVSHATRKAA